MAKVNELKSTDEMEQYGVWVKVQPEVIDESALDLDEDDFQLSDIESTDDLASYNANDDIENINLEIETGFPEEMEFDTMHEEILNIPDELEIPEDDELEIIEEDLLEFPADDGMLSIQDDEEEKTISDEVEFDLPEEDQLEITETLKPEKQDNTTSTFDSFEEISLDDFIEEGFTDPNEEQPAKIEEPAVVQAQKKPTEKMVNVEEEIEEEFFDDIMDEELPEIDVDLNQLENDIFIDDDSLDIENIEPDQILDDDLEDFLDSEETVDLTAPSLPITDTDSDDINLDDIPELDNNEELQELELDMDDELKEIEETEISELENPSDFEDLIIDEEPLESSGYEDKLVVNEEMPELSDDLMMESLDSGTNESIEDFNIEEEFPEISDDALGDIQLDEFDINSDETMPENGMEELVLDEEFPDLPANDFDSISEIEDINNTDELILNEELPDTLTEDTTDSFEDILDIDEEPEDQLTSDSEIIEVNLSDDNITPKHQFDDISEMEEDMKLTPLSHNQGELSLLQKIEQELSLIKNELSSLKSELAELRKSKGVMAEPDLQESHGFFDEEEDETIALTGDELNNILNTADITEEVADSESDTPEIVIDKSTNDSDSDFDDFTTDEITLNEVPTDITWDENPESIEATPEVAVNAMDELEEEIVLDIPDMDSFTNDNIPIEEIELDLQDEDNTEDFDLESIETMPTDEIELEISNDDILLEDTDTFMDLSTEEIELDYEEPTPKAPAVTDKNSMQAIPENLKNELKSVLAYMDQLLEALPEDKIKEFANSDYFNTYKKLFEELGLAN